jgi:hypothetical protein
VFVSSVERDLVFDQVYARCGIAGTGFTLNGARGGDGTTGPPGCNPTSKIHRVSIGVAVITMR